MLLVFCSESNSQPSSHNKTFDSLPEVRRKRDEAPSSAPSIPDTLSLPLDGNSTSSVGEVEDGASPPSPTPRTVDTMAEEASSAHEYVLPQDVPTSLLDKLATLVPNLRAFGHAVHSQAELQESQESQESQQREVEAESYQYDQFISSVRISTSTPTHTSTTLEEPLQTDDVQELDTSKTDVTYDSDEENEGIEEDDADRDVHDTDDLLWFSKFDSMVSSLSRTFGWIS